MGIIIITCLSWFGAGLFAGLGIFSMINEQNDLATFGTYLFSLNATLGVISVIRLLDAIQFVAEAAK